MHFMLGDVAEVEEGVDSGLDRIFLFSGVADIAWSCDLNIWHSLSTFAFVLSMFLFGAIFCSCSLSLSFEANFARRSRITLCRRI